MFIYIPSKNIVRHWIQRKLRMCMLNVVTLSETVGRKKINGFTIYYLQNSEYKRIIKENNGSITICWN